MTLTIDETVAVFIFCASIMAMILLVAIMLAAFADRTRKIIKEYALDYLQVRAAWLTQNSDHELRQLRVEAEQLKLQQQATQAIEALPLLLYEEIDE